MTASLAGFAISLTRHSAIGALFSFSTAAALWSNSALFHSGVLAHDFWAVFADSMTPLTSPWVQAVWVYGKKVDQQYSIWWKQKLTSLKRKLKNNNNFFKKKSQYHIIVLLLPILLNCINKTVKSTWWHRWVFFIFCQLLQQQQQLRWYRQGFDGVGAKGYWHYIMF